MRRRPLLAALPFAPMLLAGSARAEGALVDVQKRAFTTKRFRLESGVVMPEITIVYETYGTLAADGRNAVLLTHGFTSSQHMAGRYSENGAEGSWNGLVGPGKAIDTDKLFVVASNMLGSSYGSTSPAHLNPATGHQWGPDFPDITLGDIVNAQKALLDGIGVKHLVAVAGPSYRRLPDVPVGRQLSGIHGRPGARGERAQRLRRRSGSEVARCHPRQGPALERGLVLRQRRHHRHADGDAGSDTPALRHRRATGREISRQDGARDRDRPPGAQPGPNRSMATR